MADGKRKLSVSIESTSGTFNIFHVWANGYEIIRTHGEKGQWEGTIPAKLMPVTLEGVAYGTGESKYTLTIDLPGTADDQKISCALKGGYHEFKLEI